jgi:hypothetical protein
MDLSSTQVRAILHFYGTPQYYETTGDRWLPSRSTVASLSRLGILREDFRTLTSFGEDVARALVARDPSTRKRRRLTKAELADIGEANAAEAFDQVGIEMRETFDDSVLSSRVNVQDTVNELGGTEADRLTAVVAFENYLFKHGARMVGMDWVYP